MFSKQQMRFFEKASDIALQSDFDRFHLGCVAVLKNRIIAASSNKLKTHPLQAEYDKLRYKCDSDLRNMHSLHAEMSCINMIKQDVDFRYVELYIVRLLKNGSYGLARPCRSCMPFIISKGIQKIHYSTSYGFASELLKDLTK